MNARSYTARLLLRGALFAAGLFVLFIALIVVIPHALDGWLRRTGDPILTLEDINRRWPPRPANAKAEALIALAEPYRRDYRTYVSARGRVERGPSMPDWAAVVEWRRQIRDLHFSDASDRHVVPFPATLVDHLEDRRDLINATRRLLLEGQAPSWAIQNGSFADSRGGVNLVVELLLDDAVLAWSDDPQRGLDDLAAARVYLRSAADDPSLFGRVTYFLLLDRYLATARLLPFARGREVLDVGFPQRGAWVDSALAEAVHEDRRVRGLIERDARNLDQRILRERNRVHRALLRVAHHRYRRRVRQAAEAPACDVNPYLRPVYPYTPAVRFEQAVRYWRAAPILEDRVALRLEQLQRIVDLRAGVEDQSIASAVCPDRDWRIEVGPEIVHISLDPPATAGELRRFDVLPNAYQDDHGFAVPRDALPANPAPRDLIGIRPVGKRR